MTAPLTKHQDQITLDDIVAHSLTLEAACDRCPTWRPVEVNVEFPGWLERPPLREQFMGGKFTCSAHGKRPAVKMRVLGNGHVWGQRQVTATWERPAT